MIQVFKKYWVRRNTSFRGNSCENEISVGVTTATKLEHTQPKLHYFQCLMKPCLFSLIN